MDLKLRATQSLLDLNALDAQADAAMRDLMREGSSANTAASYRAAIRYWSAWFELRYGQAFTLPLPPVVVLQFIVDHAERLTAQGLQCQLPATLDQELVRARAKARLGPLKLNTLLQRISVLSKAHDIREHANNPCRDPKVRELLAKTRRAYAKRGAGPSKKQALTRAPMQALLATCDDSLRGRRDRALLLFAWSSGGRRRSEVVSATLENIKRSDNGFLYTLGHSKTNQTGRVRPEDIKPITGVAAQALQAWLDASGIASGAVFRRIRRGGVVAEPLAAAAVRDIVRERCRQAGIEGEFSAHSLRSGFVTEAGRQNIPLGETMAMTGHSSVATVMGYFRAGTAAQSRAAQLMEAHTPDTSSAADNEPLVQPDSGKSARTGQ